MEVLEVIFLLLLTELVVLILKKLKTNLDIPIVPEALPLIGHLHKIAFLNTEGKF